jgi:uncharacterized membrane protein
VIEAYLHDWASLLLRWAHLVTGIAWIGASFYFNWLENHLQRQQQDPGIAGDLWAVHGGGFYYLKKFAVAPASLPPTLHWFKWEAYATWLTGFALLVVVYYWNASAYLLEAAGADSGIAPAVAAGLGALFLSWLVYDLLCRSPLAAREALLGALIGGWFLLLAWSLDLLMSGRAAYMHVGAAIGTVMVANVFRVIIPAQKELVRAVEEGRAPDASQGVRALQRSRHNNYFTLPVLFIMISAHYPATYGHARAWLVLALLSAAGVLIRHYFNRRHLPGFQATPLLAGLALLAGMLLAGLPRAAGHAEPGSAAVSDAAAFAVVQDRCSGCHSAQPSQAGFNAAPLGVELDSVAQLRRHADRVYTATVVSRSMPLGNLTGISDAERELIARWYQQRSSQE